MVCGLLISYDDEHLANPPQRGFSIKNSKDTTTRVNLLYFPFFSSLTNGGDDKMAAILSHLVSDPLFCV